MRIGTNGHEPVRLVEPDLGELSRLGLPRMLRKNQSLFLTGELEEVILLVKTGRLKLSRLSAEGKELILFLLEPGDVLVPPGLRAFRGAESVVEALQDGLVLVVKRQDFEAFLRARPAVAFTVIQQLAGRVRSLEERIEEMVFKDIPRRLASALLRLAAEYGSEQPNGGLAVGLRVTQQDLANFIGASREMVNHALSSWKREGVIELHGRSIVIRRAEDLEARELAQ